MEAEWIKKIKTLAHAVYKRLISDWKTHRLKSEVMEKDILWKWKQKQKTERAGVAILIPDKTNFKTKAI